MRERPILFSPPMIRALLANRKTQTRRIAAFPSWVDLFTPQIGEWFEGHGEHPIGPCEGEKCAHIYYEERTPSIYSLRCPYGVVGDRLWIKESYKFDKFWEAMGVDDWAASVNYPADGAVRQVYQCDAPEHVGFWPGAAIRKYEGRLRPSIFMYRWVSRITLEISDVRVERVQDITEEDAVAEGVIREDLGYDQDNFHPPGSYGYVSGLHPFPKGKIHVKATEAYRELWEEINGKDSWKKNPWVWVVKFMRGE